MIDRTFCALRVWAVIRPNEMRTWIRILDDEKMRKALTWLLQHPVGEGSKRVSRSDSVAQPDPREDKKNEPRCALVVCRLTAPTVPTQPLIFPHR